MDDDKTINNKILGLLTFVILSFVSFVCILFIGIAKVEAQEIGRIFYNGVQQGQTFTFGDADDVAEWTNTNANNIRYDNNNLLMGTGTTYTFSARFTILLQDDIDSLSTIQATPGYYRSGSLYNFKDTTCNVDYNSKILSTTTTKKTVEHYISISCPDISFSTASNYIVVRFFVSNSGYYYNIIEMSRTGLIYKDNTNLTESDKIIISQNQNAQDIINNQNTNTDKITQNQDKNTQNITNKLEELDDTNQGILDTIRSFFGNFFGNLINSIVGIFLPDDFDFLNGFLDTLENKLGFIASVPIQILEFLIDLVTYDFDTMTSIILPSFSVLEYDLWDSQEIDLTEIINTFEPYRIYTNIACVSLCAYYLMKLYENFASGGGN